MGKYSLIACGGTFDFFHAGHKTFLEQVLSQTDKLVLGITSDAYVKSFKNSDRIEPFEFRKSVVEKFLDSIGSKDRVKIVPIDDICGPLLTNDFDLQAIAVTPQTKEKVGEINQKRKEKNLPELKVILLALKTAEDGNIISATRIRNGEINRDGKLYLNLAWQNKTLVLPKDLRSVLQHPWTKVLNDLPADIDGSKAITIGDITTQRFNQKGIGQFLSVVDFLVHREVAFHDLSELGFRNEQNVQKVKNPHGTLTPQLFQALLKVFKTKEKKIILVIGEEDLVVLACLLIAPLGFSIFYGQPNEGLVQVEVSEDNKEKAYNLIESFDKE